MEKTAQYRAHILPINIFWHAFLQMTGSKGDPATAGHISTCEDCREKMNDLMKNNRFLKILSFGK